MRRSFSVVSGAVALVTSFLVLLPGTAHAATSFVPCDVHVLVANMNTAGSGDTLSLAGGCTYTLNAPNDADGLPVIAKTLTVVGNGTAIAAWTWSAPTEATVPRLRHEQVPHSRTVRENGGTPHVPNR
jgi:hypothetical protein